MSAVLAERPAHGDIIKFGQRPKEIPSGRAKPVEMVFVYPPQPPTRSINQLTADYANTYVHTPGLLRRTHQDLWNSRLQAAELPLITIPTPPFTQRQITVMEREGFVAGYMPQHLATAGNREELARVLDLSVTRVRDAAGESVIKLNAPNNVYGEETVDRGRRDGGFWYVYQRSTHASAEHVNKTELQTAQLFARQDSLPMTLTIYLAAVGDTRDFKGFTMDPWWNGHTHLVGSVLGDKTLQAKWPKGGLALDDNPVWRSHYPGVGGRPVWVYDQGNAKTIFAAHMASRVAMHS